MMKPKNRRDAKKRLQPKILIFDIDGVLIDVRGTYWRSALETVPISAGSASPTRTCINGKANPGTTMTGA